ncbi:hypothetical protein QZH41_017922 [Actinostola sp. cb2023]|nr:hypothetical protein QZH41_017922 [Actinostola sp. cb2023]
MKKDRATYQCLFQKITALYPDMKQNLKAYGTDSELPLRQALELEFPFAIGFICRTHIVRNLEHKLKSEFQLTDKFFRSMVADVFGNKSQEGLVHCKSRHEYDILLAKLCVKWDRDEIEERKVDAGQEPRASNYFMKNKAEVVYHHCRTEALKEVGINEELFDNNDPESINALIKKWENREKHDIPKFVSDMKELQTRQRHDIQRAFCGTPTLYTVKEEYKKFTAGTSFWDLSQKKRQDYLAKVSEVPNISPPIVDSHLDPIECLSEVFFPSEVSSLKAKVVRLLNGNLRAGFSGPKSRIIASETGIPQIKHYTQYYSSSYSKRK